jgi:hypothetical protein
MTLYILPHVIYIGQAAILEDVVKDKWDRGLLLDLWECDFLPPIF